MNTKPLSRLQKHLYDMKFSMREIDNVGRQLEKISRLHRLKCKHSIKQANIEKARGYAENAIYNSKVANDYFQTSARIGAIVHCVETAIKHNTVQKSTESIIKCMRNAVKRKELLRASHIMDIFEKEIENLGVKYSVVQKAMFNASATSLPQQNVEALIRQIRDEIQLDSRLRLPPITRFDPEANEDLGKRYSNLKK